MRYRFIASLAVFLTVLLAAFAAPIAPIAKGQDVSKDATNHVMGLYLMSDYPAVTLRPGETSTINLKLQNYDLPPERLSGWFPACRPVDGDADGWRQPVAAAMPATNSNVALELRLDVPKSRAVGTETLTVTATGGSTNASLPIAVTLAKDLPAKLSLTPQLPDLRGNLKSSFEYQLAIKNDSGKKLTVSLSAQDSAELQLLIHGRVWQPGAQRGPDRCRPVEDREAQSNAAEYGGGGEATRSSRGWWPRTPRRPPT